MGKWRCVLTTVQPDETVPITLSKDCPKTIRSGKPKRRVDKALRLALVPKVTAYSAHKFAIGSWVSLLDQARFILQIRQDCAAG